MVRPTRERLDQDPFDVGPLRTEANTSNPADHFCPLCDCMKSGYVTHVNVSSPRCTNQGCPCHDWLLPYADELV